MSALDQPILIANSGYHVGHLRSIQAAKDQGFFREEGLSEYKLETSGLIPGPLEREGLALVMKEHGVDIATAVNIQSAIIQRARGNDVYVVGGWRYASTRSNLFGAKGMNSLKELRGHKIGIRERGGLQDRFMSVCLLRAGVDPQTEVEWVQDPVFAYSNTSEHLDFLRSGKVDAMIASGSYAEQLQREGFPLLVDGSKVHEEEGTRPPGRVIVATSQTIEKRGMELGAFLRANIRAFHFISGKANFHYCWGMETRLRRATHNEHERGLRIVTDPSRVAGHMPLDGQISRPGLASIIKDMVECGEIGKSLEVDDVLRDGLAVDALKQLKSRDLI